MESDQLLTVAQVAALLQVPQQTLYGWRTRNMSTLRARCSNGGALRSVLVDAVLVDPRVNHTDVF